MKRSPRVHVWPVALDAPGERMDEHLAALDADELERASRLRAPRDSRRFVVAHGRLRQLLARELGIRPAEVALRREPRGRPYVKGSDVRFSLARSAGFALVALTRGRAVGVDVERRRDGIACAEIARHFFSPREAAHLRALPEPARSATFLTWWTRKEAVLKATGEGITERLAAAPPPGWSVRDLAAGPGHFGAVAVQDLDPVVVWHGTPA
ncbi:MAG TPA: 4'-phosphopantetheinyl transferase superfamily protein [Solirubrobacteraceae bacterium]|jgi:4'-phosphopantetheinyl transferase